jgi:hypothetical protein
VEQNAGIVITGNSATFTYDGAAHGVAGVQAPTLTLNSKVYNGQAQLNGNNLTVTFNVDGKTYTVTGVTVSNPTSTNADMIPNVVNVSKAVVKDQTGKEVKFKVTGVNGLLHIRSLEVVVGVQNATKVAGEDDPTFIPVITGTIGGTGVAYTFIRQPGEDAGTYTITPTGAEWQFNNNYHVTYVPGTLTITAAEDTIEDPPVPQAGPEDIIDDPAPKAAPAGSSWSLIDLICAILTTLVGLVMAGTYFKKKDEDENEEPKRNLEEGEEDKNDRKKSKFFGILPAAAAIITFILTQDLSGLMVLIDKWTPLMIVYVLANGVLAYVTRNQKKEEKETVEAV